MTKQSPLRFIRRREVQQLTGLSQTTLWRLEKAGTFPRRRRLSSHAVGWPLSEIEAWLSARREVPFAATGTEGSGHDQT